LNDKLSVFHPQAPNFQIPDPIPIDHADNKLTQLWCYGVEGVRRRIAGLVACRLIASRGGIGR
jgi:hypothetical protein